MTTEVGKGKSSRERRRSVSQSSNESPASSGDEDVDKTASNADLSFSDITDLSRYSMNVDEGDVSPVMVPKPGHHAVASKSSTSYWLNSADADDTHTITHQHTKTLIRRPLYSRGADRTKDSYIEYTSQCTVISKHNESSGGRITHLVTALVLICAVCSTVFLLTFVQPSGSKLYTSHTKPSSIAPEMFLEAFHSIREPFQVQTSGFWGVIRAAIKPIVLQEDPDQPAVFVLVVPSDTHETTACFLRLFSNTLTRLFQTTSPVEFFTDAVSGLSPERVKRMLDDRMRAGLGSGARIAIVRHLEQLHGESATMLHAYCDNDNAPFRRAIFLLVLFVDESSSEVSETEAFVEQRLKQLWGDALGSNKFYPLLTRIAHSVVFMRPETNDVLMKIKC